MSLNEKSTDVYQNLRRWYDIFKDTKILQTKERKNPILLKLPEISLEVSEEIEISVNAHYNHQENVTKIRNLITRYEPKRVEFIEKTKKAKFPSWNEELRNREDVRKLFRQLQNIIKGILEILEPIDKTFKV